MFDYSNYQSVLDTISGICQRAGRNPASVTLLPVSKTVDVKTLQEAADQGVLLFGENRVQEAEKKYSQLPEETRFHLIGHLQSNKSVAAVRLFEVIHSIDKISTARKVDNAARTQGKIQRIFFQVNTTNEESKNGARPETVLDMCREIDTFDNIALEGLMTIGPLTGNRESIRSSFVLLRQLKDQLSDTLGHSLPHLSMGMSGDYDIAIEEGATIVRIGSLIFGNRQ